MMNPRRIFVFLMCFGMAAVVFGAGGQVFAAEVAGGANLYSQYCASCHGTLANSEVMGSTVKQITSAIGNIRSMRSLRTLTSAQRTSIASALTGSGTGGGGTGGTAAAAHASIAAYNGPSTCVACHQTQAQAMFGSVHYKWDGATPFADNIPGNAGKANKAMNTYCGTVATSFTAACWTCHVGNGKMPEATMTTAQLNNIDCLVCHQDKYVRKVAGPTTQVTGTGPTGGVYTWNIPVTDSKGGFSFQPDTAKMTVSILEAARTVTKPSKAACLSCHAKGGGGNGFKRGDLAVESASASPDVEFHMSPQGANLNCQSCHKTTNHKIAGRGLDLRESDVPAEMTCQTGGCHSTTPHSNSRLNTHTSRVACQTCHIPTFGNLPAAGTEVDRDWTKPYWSASACNGQGGWKPEEIIEANLIPTYKWYNQHSNVYVLGTAPLALNSSGEYEFAMPIGSRTIVGSKIYPMKEHTSNSAMLDKDPNNNLEQIIPFSTAKYFMTGDFNAAVAEGMTKAGLTGNWKMVRVHTYQTINHGTQPSDNALSCGECHKSLSTSGQLVRMDLQGQLGYALKGPQSSVCVQCHGKKESLSFTKVHNKHVTDKKLDCNKCHGFTKS